MMYWLIPLCLVSYFIGNVNVAVLLSKRVLKKDIRTLASGNPGTMNMLRNFGFKWGFITFLLDMSKSIVPALTGALIYGYSSPEGKIALFACGLSAVLGQVYPVVYGFKGGKGAASMTGVFLVASPIAWIIAFPIIFVQQLFVKYGAVSSFLIISSMVGWNAYLNSGNTAVCAILLCYYMLMCIVHRTNIYRLLTGKENRALLFKKRKRAKLMEQQKTWLAEVGRASNEA